MATKPKPKLKGLTIAVSPKAHDVLKAASNKKPRKTIRAIINIKLNLPEHE